MPDHVFTGPYPVTYTEGRDARDLPLGDVEPGEIRDLDEVPDHQWREATDEDRDRWAAILAGRETSDEGDEDGDGLQQHPGFGVPMHGTEGTPDGTFFEVSNEAPDGSEGQQVTETPSGPVPAPPAVIPGA